MAKVKNEENNINIGKTPPQDIELEKVVLGALLLESEAIERIIDILTNKSFYDTNHQIIYESICSLYRKNVAIDYLTVNNDLKAKEKLQTIGGTSYLVNLTNNLATSSHIEHHSRILEQKHIQRELIKAGIEIQDIAFDKDEDIENMVDFAEKKIFDISEGKLKKDIQPLKLIIEETLEKLKKLQENKETVTGIPSGIEELDKITMGFQASDLIIVAARPSVGKTSLVISMARNMAVEHEKTVAIFSLEMSQDQLAKRLLSIQTGINGEFFKTGKFNSNSLEKIKDAQETFAITPIYIDDTASISLYEFKSKCRRLGNKLRANNKKLDCVIIDYLQLMTTGTKEGSRELEISLISRTLKAVAKELNVPVIALSQLNRSVETRGGDNRLPQLSDLRESGAIEQDADIVLFIDRPETYGIDKINEKGKVLKSNSKLDSDDTKYDEYVPTSGLAQISIAKHRNGNTGKIWLQFDHTTTKFSDLDKNHPFRQNYSLSAEEYSKKLYEKNGNLNGQTLKSKINQYDNFENNYLNNSQVVNVEDIFSNTHKTEAPF
ncbi:MAG: replicative DNA helicase [Bacteroidales bacterium]|jgi:replicative DNA helicase|nr:replicative DNA helicase [Bacteroidales bacterium]